MARRSTDRLDANRLLEVLAAMERGDFTGVRMPARGTGLAGRIASTLNRILDRSAAMTAEFERVAEVVGRQGRLSQRASLPGVGGGWAQRIDALNEIIADLAQPTVEISRVIEAVARGDLSQKMAVHVDGRPIQGEFLRMATITNTMVDQLASFASEVTRVARDVGTEGKLGGRAEVSGVSGTWRDLTDNVNSMASNLTDQVRGIATVVTAVASGDLRRKLALSARGEIAALAETINGMIDTLATFAEQVTGVAREVGIEGKLGGQAVVPGAAGTWRDLTDNVNQLAANLTTQVRAIAEVATAVTKGDLTRSISVSAQGEVAALKDNINQMIANLRATTQENTEQDWLKTNLARFTGILQGQRDLDAVSRLILKELAPLVNAQHGVFYVMESGEVPVLKLLSSYAYRERKGLTTQFAVGEGLVGQCALEKTRILVTDVPDDYIRISSGLGTAPPRSIVVLPVLFEGQVKAVIELASFHRFSDIHLAFLDQLTESIGVVLNTIAAGMRTEVLLRQSQSLAQELQAQQQVLQRTNEELEERSRLLQAQYAEVERKNREIEQAKRALEERAQQLAQSSRYKSEFLANMSHELRTPLNSLLILAKLLADNAEGNLEQRQVEFAQTIYSSGYDLLALINDILDLSKIEAGAMQLEVAECALDELCEAFERSFRPVAEQKGLRFEVKLDPRVQRSIWTDERRLKQVVKNLLSNAFKFTERGEVTLEVAPADGGWTPGDGSLDDASPAVAFRVSDTGIGIPHDKQTLIFEAFQQLDGTTSRKYGGTGLGLAISREIARLLGGAVTVSSEPGRGSTFTLFVPHHPVRIHAPARRERPALAEGGPAAPPSGDGLDGVLAGSPPAVRNEALAGGDPPAAAPASDALAGRRILVVDDDVRTVFALTALLERNGAEVLCAESAADGMATLRSTRVDLVILDVMMPDMDGYEAMRAIRAEPDLRDLPVIALTAKAMKGDRERCLEAGASDYVTKPVDNEQLLSLVRLWLHERRERAGRALDA